MWPTPDMRFKVRARKHGRLTKWRCIAGFARRYAETDALPEWVCNHLRVMMKRGVRVEEAAVFYRGARVRELDAACAAAVDAARRGQLVLTGPLEMHGGAE